MATVDTSQSALGGTAAVRSKAKARARAWSRLALVLGWTFACWPVLKVSGLFGQSASKRVALAWINGMRRLIGLRVVAHGRPPKPPYFLVCNHLAWLDFFGCYSLIDATGIVEEPMARMPVLGAFIRALDPIFVRRVKEDTARVTGLMVEAIQAGRSLIMAPETPFTTVRRGAGVRQFRGGLLQAAVVARKPVHYMSITYRTPNGVPPSKALIFGPNPYLPTADGKIPESEWRMYERQTFFQHLMKVLALPFFEFDATFGAEPVTAGDRIELANRLHEKVTQLFVPFE